jgi:hypothetical protein
VVGNRQKDDPTSAAASQWSVRPALGSWPICFFPMFNSKIQNRARMGALSQYQVHSEPRSSRSKKASFEKVAISSGIYCQVSGTVFRKCEKSLMMVADN